MEDFFDYAGVQDCQKLLDTKFSEFAELLKKANDYMNENVNVSHDSSMYGVLAGKVLADWNENASTFSDFYENFQAWSELMASIMASYGTFEMDTVKNAMNANQSDGSGLRGVAETRAAIKFNTDEADRAIAYEQEKVDRINPTSFANAGWEKAVVNNAAYYTTEKIQATETKIANGETLYDTDGNAVVGLKLRPDKMDENNWNEYLIYEGYDSAGNLHYYSIESDGEVKMLDSEHVKDIGTVAGNLKVGDEFQISVDWNGDNNFERVCKASYIVGYHEGSNQTYMALPHSDGSVEYYTVKGKITSYDINNNSTRNNYGEITNINVTATDVKNAGLTPLYEDQTFSSQDVGAVKSQYEFNNINQ